MSERDDRLNRQKSSIYVTDKVDDTFISNYVANKQANNPIINQTLSDNRLNDPDMLLDTLDDPNESFGDRDDECNEHTDCPYQHYCHSGWDGTAYGPSF